MSKPHLRLCIYYATKHAQLIMKELGITYQIAVPQSMGDQWWFFNCENVPDPLPENLTLITQSPHEMIGYGLSKEDADSIVKNN